MIQFTHQPRLWWIASGALVVLVMLAMSYGRAKGRPRPSLKWTLISLRFLVIAAVVFCLLDPQWVETIKHQQKSRAAILLDTSSSMSLRDVPNGRFLAAKEWLKNELIPDAPPGVTLSTYAFDRQLQPVTSLDSASPTGTVTALSEALETLLALPGEDPLTSVILVSDGIENASENPERMARLYRRKGIPIHTVTVGTTNDMQDVIIDNIQVKRAVPNEAPTRVALALRSPGYKDVTVPVQIRGPKGIVAVREIKLSGAAQTVEIEVTPRQKGFQVYEAVIPPQANEWLSSNNRRLFGLEVVDPTIRVIYMEGTPQKSGTPIPEWKYLKDALTSDPNIKVTTLYRQVGANGQFLNTLDTDPESGEKIYPVEHPTLGFPKSLAGLLEYDVVIHSDIKKESFSADQLKNMARLVEEFGGGFVMIGGNSAFGKGGYHRTILDRIIPVAMEKENDSLAQPVQLQVPRAVFTHPLINIGSTREETEMIWTKKFPTLYGFNLVDRAKPGALVLGQHPNHKNAFGQVVLLAVQEIGKGRSMAFTSDTTRTWGRDFETIWGEPIRPGLALSEANCDSRYYRQFWVNAVRWLANGRIGQTNNAVTVELTQSYAHPGETVAARIKVRDSELKEIVNSEVSLLISNAGLTNRPLLARYDAESKSYVANLRLASASTNIVTAVARRAGLKLGEDHQLLVCETSDQEMSDVRARPDFMAALARDSGGSSFTPADSIQGSPGYVFANAPPPTIEYRRTSVWDKAIWMVLLLALLGTEWALRRVRGLA